MPSTRARADVASPQKENIMQTSEAKLKAVLCAALTVLLATVTSTVFAQPYPSKPVKIIVPYAAGGGTDAVARLLAQQLRGPLGQPVIIENRGGAGTLIGTDAVAKAAPDGYTLLLHTDMLPVFPMLYANLNFDVAKDFTPVSIVASGTIVLVAYPSVPAKNVQELVALARKTPGSITMATAGNGTSHDLAGMLFARKADVKFNYIAYKGNGPAMTDVLAGHVALGLFSLPSVTQFAKDGRLKLLAVFNTQRHPLEPNVPTIAEAGYPGVEYSVRYAISAPGATPKTAVAKLQNAFSQIAKDSAYRNELSSVGFDAQFTTADETAQIMQRQREQLTPVLKAAHVVPQ